ncbi:hypothetical protein RJ641_009372 [Dillenia turbinata]|uniref:Uncharacterized protein n=1 Tax=Dillenia turbinata TaxID=194707 RepID=A0AAN8V7N7_9MAGN
MHLQRPRAVPFQLFVFPNSDRSTKLQNVWLQADFIEELLHGRFIEEEFTPAMLTAYDWQVSVGNISYEEIYDVYAATRGLSGSTIKKLPCHIISDDFNDAQNIWCTICLQVPFLYFFPPILDNKVVVVSVTDNDANSLRCWQDIEVGEPARSLLKCSHT